MSLGFVLPLFAAGIVCLAVGASYRRLRPEAATRSLAVASAALAASTLWALLTLFLGAIAEIPSIDSWSAWCPTLYRADDHIAPWMGAAAGVGLVLASVRVIRLVMAEARTRRRLPRCNGGVLIIPDEEPVAYAVPGRHGGIVVSSGMMDALDLPERSVLWAHEQSHLDHRHHRYVFLARVASAGVPILRPLATRVRLSTERWADEDAASHVGGDRLLVARAIARAALATSGHHGGALALAETNIAARVRALVDEGRVAAPITGSLAVAAVIVTTLGSSTVQFHHLVAFVAHVCRGT